MAASEKQIRANRANAQKSTGPQTPEGKAISSRNAVTHGRYARDLIITSRAFTESEEEYNHILLSLIEELRPSGVFQEHLVRKIANCLWRSRRVLRAETAHVNRQLASIKTDRALAACLDKLLGGTGADDPAAQSADQHAGQSIDIDIRCIPMPDIAPHMLRYEMRLDRQLSRAYKLLVQLKRLRLGEEQNENEGSIKNDETNPMLHIPDPGI